MPPWNTGKGKRKSTDDNDETMEPIASGSSKPPPSTHKKLHSDTVTQDLYISNLNPPPNSNLDLDSDLGPRSDQSTVEICVSNLTFVMEQQK